MNLVELFLSFLQIGLFSIGGGYAAIPLIRYQTVILHGWLTESQFLDLATIAEMTPGPIAINGATFVGLQVAGIPGAIVATLGCIFPSLILVSILAWVYRKYRTLPLLQGILASLRPAVPVCGRPLLPSSPPPASTCSFRSFSAAAPFTCPL